MAIPQTVRGYDPFEVMSALQKSIRRGDYEQAMYWGLELGESPGPIHFTFLINRLRVIVHEDIGTGDMTACLFSLRALDDMRFWREASKGTWKLGLANIILALCRATKSRDGDNLVGVALHERATTPKREIPDYALDKHTQRGKSMGRGMDHFLEQGAILIPDGSDQKLAEKAQTAFRWLATHKDTPTGTSTDKAEEKQSKLL